MRIEPIYREIGRNIRTRRRQKDLSQDEVAQLLAISRATLANIETGRQRILVHQIYRLAEVLGAKPTDLMPPQDVTVDEPLSLESLQFQGDVSSEHKMAVFRLISSVPTQNRKTSDTANAKPANQDSPSKVTRGTRRKSPR